MKRMLWAVGCGVVIALILGIKGFLSAESYLIPVRDRLSFVKVWVGYHVGNGEDSSSPFGVGWRMDFQYRIDNDGCRECPLIVTADLLGRVKGLYGTYSSNEKTEIPHEVIDAIRINFDNQGENGLRGSEGAELKSSSYDEEGKRQGGVYPL